MFYAVIPAGGSGTRLWPLSRAGHPKFLHPLSGGVDSLLQATVARLGPLAGPERTFVVTGVAHAAAVARQLPVLPGRNLLVEPSPRDSCAAIGLAAALIARRDPDAVMGSFAADHLIGDVDRFREVISQAVAGARAGHLMTVGITPTRPETGYGYLHCAEQLDGPARRVAEFKEKPPYDVAVGYVDSGQYLWNASMFVWKVAVFLAELERQNPRLHAGLDRIAAAWGAPEQDEVLGEVWPTLEKISVDYAVMEGAAAAGRVATVPGDFGWNDVGDFHTLGEVLPGDDDGNAVLSSGRVLLDDCSGSVVVSQTDRLVAGLGLRDLVVVDTPDVVMVCPRGRAQEVKRLVDALKGRGDGDLV
ncbi:mannose-1-phosphate guanylyltransferase [Pilimelia columellifera]|uniref:Mannose-1-phosphate guanylyltransferase n=1 Tax=Pilimelia columellifera subsp. columellifera TaxID=706583 RepID=A0ABN3N6P9_9ACTN